MSAFRLPYGPLPRSSAVLAALFIGIAASQARADQPAKTATPAVPPSLASVSPEQRALAADVVRLMRLERTFDATGYQMLVSAKNQAMSLGTPPTAAGLAQLQSRIMQLKDTYVREQLAALAGVYAETLPLGTLKAMKGFYASPEGQAFVNDQTLITDRMKVVMRQSRTNLPGQIRAIVVQVIGKPAAGPKPAFKLQSPLPPPALARPPVAGAAGASPAASLGK